MPKFITSNVEASNIGRQIAEEVFDEQRKAMESPSTTQDSTPSPPHPQVPGAVPTSPEVGSKYVSLAPQEIPLPSLGELKEFASSDEVSHICGLTSSYYSTTQEQKED